MERDRIVALWPSRTAVHVGAPTLDEMSHTLIVVSRDDEISVVEERTWMARIVEVWPTSVYNFALLQRRFIS